MATVDGNIDDDDDDSEPSSGSSRPVKVKPRKRQVVDDDDDNSIVGGRFMLVVVFILAACFIPPSKLGEWMEPKEPEATRVETWAPGVESTVRITLVTADYGLLGCAAEQSFDGVHCGHKSPTEPWPRESADSNDDNNNKANIIQPYRTWYDNKLVFVAGLWATPDVAYRLHQEPPGGVLPEKLARFAVECKVKFLGTLDKGKLRWNPQQSWVDPDATPWAAKALTCKLIEEPQ
ncbi:MAG: hypothetical protein QM756_32150 [Polyangiaceae bacterium]